MKLNKKGYMLVEIVVASVIAFSIAFYLLNLTYKFKDRNEEVYDSIGLYNIKINITKNIMDDLVGKSNVITSQTRTATEYRATIVSTTESGQEIKNLVVTKNTITYGNGNPNPNDKSYYKKELDDYSEFDIANISSTDKYISIPITNIYSDNIYYIKLMISQFSTKNGVSF